MAKTQTRRRGGAKAIELDWYEADEVPRPEMPDGQRLAKRQRRFRRMVWATIIICPLSLLALMSAVESRAKAVPTTSDSTSSSGRAAATIELDQWLAETPSPLPGATILSWDGATTISPPPVPKGQATPAPLTWKGELDTFTLASGANTYTVGVEVALDPRGGAVAVAGPSIEANAPAATDGWDAGTPWPGITAGVNVSGSVQTVINGWLAAYISGSSSQLGLAVGDPNAAHGYVPLSGVRSATDTVLDAATIGSKAANEVIVEIGVGIVWDGETAPSPSASSGSTAVAPTTTMDLLIERASTAAPVVVAWGPAGTGPTLTPYQNAVDPAGRNLSATAPASSTPPANLAP